MKTRHFRFVVKDVCGDYTHGMVFETDDVALEKNKKVADQFGIYDKFSFVDQNGDTVSFMPKNCIWLKLEEIEGV